jgi:hypothetical protein
VDRPVLSVYPQEKEDGDGKGEINPKPEGIKKVNNSSDYHLNPAKRIIFALKINQLNNKPHHPSNERRKERI